MRNHVPSTSRQRISLDGHNVLQVQKEVTAQTTDDCIETFSSNIQLFSSARNSRDIIKPCSICVLLYRLEHCFRNVVCNNPPSFSNPSCGTQRLASRTTGEVENVSAGDNSGPVKLGLCRRLYPVGIRFFPFCPTGSCPFPLFADLISFRRGADHVTRQFHVPLMAEGV